MTVSTSLFAPYLCSFFAWTISICYTSSTSLPSPFFIILFIPLPSTQNLVILKLHSPQLCCIYLNFEYYYTLFIYFN